jgi:hypothetical protein
VVHLHPEHLPDIAAPVKHVVVSPLAQGEQPEAKSQHCAAHHTRSALAFTWAVLLR